MQAFRVETVHVDGHVDSTVFSGSGESIRVASETFNQESAHMSGKKSISLEKGFIDSETDEFVVNVILGRR